MIPIPVHARTGRSWRFLVEDLWQCIPLSKTRFGQVLPSGGAADTVLYVRLFALMSSLLKRQLLARRMKQLISLATEAIYSEQFDDMSTLVASLSGDKGGIDLVRAYISIRIATRLTEPPSDADVDDAIKRLHAAESHLNTPDFDDILDVHKELAELHWLRKHAAILRGKLAHKTDEDSYEGTIYAIQNARKGPITIEEREKVKETTKEISDLNRQIEEHELKALKESDSEAYQSYKEELEIRSLQGEIVAHEGLKAEAEAEEITARLEQKLKRLIHQESSEPDAPEASSESIGGKSTKAPELQESLKADISQANKNITHADFIAGVQSGTMGFKCMFGEPYQFIRGAYRTIFNILVLLYKVAPIVFIPLWAWHERNWWLLIGIVVSDIATRTAARLIYNEKKQNSIGAILLIISIVCWFRFGIHSYYTFFALSALWGLMFFLIADNAEKEYAMQSLIENPEVFEDAIAQNKIIVVRKDGERK